MKKRLLALLLCVSCTLAFAACGSAAGTGESTDVQSAESGQSADVGQTGEGTVYKIGICNYVDDASLNQIVENIEAQLAALESEYNVTFEISYDNCNADANVLSQIVANFVADEVDLMIGVATPVAMTMQAATEGTDIPVVFAAVSDPLSTGLVESLENPGSNVTGTSDALDTEAILNLMLLADPDLETVGLLYDVGQDASTTAIAEAKAFFEAKGITVVEKTGTKWHWRHRHWQMPVWRLFSPPPTIPLWKQSIPSMRSLQRRASRITAARIPLH